MSFIAEFSASSPATLQGMLGTLTFDDWKANIVSNVKRRPSDVRLRWLLFELLCVDGEWDRALRQLQTWTMLESEGTSRAQMYRELIRCENLRTAVFDGRRTPNGIDPLPPWVDTLTRANAKLVDGDIATADVLRGAALGDAPATRGHCPQVGDFAWLTDSDTRVGPICELVVAGGYRWIPFDEMQTLTLGPITSLTDLVWRSAVISLRNATVLRGFLPVRYPGSENGPASLKLARETTWKDIGITAVIALGQKTWSSDKGDIGLLDISECRFSHDEHA
ncbi:type VI secretion system accessory protein TagJ [Burkholderia anthina]|uniref:ImpE protein superfamily protein n=2 Tax=Burkholderia anthina TaxID=179879 RepID=A0A6P2GJA5_9BURK|nr:ImpE protein superfamily protein [Burkholderia anthina]